MSARDDLIAGARKARLNSFNGANELVDCLADWWLAESAAHFHNGETLTYVYDMPGMDLAPSVRAARAYLRGESA